MAIMDAKATTIVPKQESVFLEVDQQESVKIVESNLVKPAIHKAGRSVGSMMKPVRPSRFAEFLFGDETGCVQFTSRNEQEEIFKMIGFGLHMCLLTVILTVSLYSDDSWWWLSHEPFLSFPLTKVPTYFDDDLCPPFSVRFSMYNLYPRDKRFQGRVCLTLWVMVIPVSFFPVFWFGDVIWVFDPGIIGMTLLSWTLDAVKERVLDDVHVRSRTNNVDNKLLCHPPRFMFLTRTPIRTNWYQIVTFTELVPDVIGLTNAIKEKSQDKERRKDCIGARGYPRKYAYVDSFVSRLSRPDRVVNLISLYSFQHMAHIAACVIIYFCSFV